MGRGRTTESPVELVMDQRHGPFLFANSMTSRFCRSRKVKGTLKLAGPPGTPYLPRQEAKFIPAMDNRLQCTCLTPAPGRPGSRAPHHILPQRD